MTYLVVVVIFVKWHVDQSIIVSKKENLENNNSQLVLGLGPKRHAAAPPRRGSPASEEIHGEIIKLIEKY